MIFEGKMVWAKASRLRVMASAALAVAAALVFQGCSTVRGGAADGNAYDYGWDEDAIATSSDGVLPTEAEAEGQSVREAAEAARAAKEAASEKAAEAEPEKTAEAVPEKTTETAAPAAPQSDEIPPAAPPPVAVETKDTGIEVIASLPDVKESVAMDGGELFTDDEGKSMGNKFEPIIGQGYRLKITVRVGDRDEVGPLEAMVSEKGEISLPLVGRVHCDGMTINALHSRLSGIFSDYFTDPDVEVQFAYSDDGISPYGQVLVQGRVLREGWVNIPPTRNLRLSHAIQRSGGFASSALRRKVLVLRRGDDGKLERHVIDFKAIGKNGELENDILLEPNDVIYVDESNF